jgi:hypothetical protein
VKLRPKHLALAACVSLSLAVGLAFVGFVRTIILYLCSSGVTVGMIVSAFMNFALSIPLPLFLFYVWKNANGSESAESPLKPADAHGKTRTHPPAIFAGLSLVAPLLGFGIGVMIVLASSRSTSSGAGGIAEIIFGIGGAFIASVIGVGLAAYALWRRERWPILGVLALLTNGDIIQKVLERIIR